MYAGFRVDISHISNEPMNMLVKSNTERER